MRVILIGYLTKTKKAVNRLICSFFVHPAGIEPTSSEPESDILSIELRAQDYLTI